MTDPFMESVAATVVFMMTAAVAAMTCIENSSDCADDD